MGALLVTVPQGAAVLLTGLAAGRIHGETALGALAADAALIPILSRTRGRAGAVATAAVLIPMLVKRLVANRHAATRSTVSVHRPSRITARITLVPGTGPTGMDAITAGRDTKVEIRWYLSECAHGGPRKGWASTR
jgi:hypothetical protein